VTVRRATKTESEEIARVLRAAFADVERLYIPAAFDATTPGVEAIRERFAEGPSWVALDGGHIVGTVGAVQRKAGLYVRSMAVLPEARGRGVARALMAELERFARGTRAPRMYLSTTPFLYSAIRLYESIGFRRTNDPPHDLFGTPLFTMAKELRRSRAMVGKAAP